MLNYSNLNDVEFEDLCCDVMSAKLGVNLRRFAAGRDGGIDLADRATKPTIIVQAKHYTHTSFSGLIASLKKELEKVESLKPTQYYVCCSKSLSPPNIAEIYEIFSDYMESDANIIDLIQIDSFLVAADNISILKRHYKLWIESTSILQNVFNSDIFIDSEVLLADINDYTNLFVQTSAYDIALDCLTKHKTLLITGDPGVGKTITSKMLVLHFAAENYQVRFTTAGDDIASLKRSLSQSPEAKEIILLDDCFGQAYFNMKETKGNELLSLIKHVKLSKNKRLLLNSRVTIYKEARSRTPELIRSFESKEFKVHCLNMSNIPAEDKARILYNHLYFNDIPQAYFDDVKLDGRYRRIIIHPNYNPRIIEFVCNPNRYTSVQPTEFYANIINHLNHPAKIWDDEYEHRILTTDRVLLTTLYSLTTTTAPESLVKECFNKRVNLISGIDTTINQYDKSLRHLLGGFIRIVDEKGVRSLSVANPSINDYLDSRLVQNPLEKAALITSAVTIQQLRRLLLDEEYAVQLKTIFDDLSVTNFIFANDEEKTGFISYYVSCNTVCDKRYQPYIQSHLHKPRSVNIFDKQRVSFINVFLKLTSEPIYSFYCIQDEISDFTRLEAILNNFTLSDLIDAIVNCFKWFSASDEFREMCLCVLEDAILAYYEEVNAEEYDIDVQQHLISTAYSDPEAGAFGYTDESAAKRSIAEEIKDILTTEIEEIISALPEELSTANSFINRADITVIGVDELMESYSQPDDAYDEDYHRDSRYSSSDSADEIDLIFDR